MSKNIQINYKKGVEVSYTTVSTEEMRIPSMCFDSYEEAEFAVSLCKLMQANGKDTMEVLKLVPYMLRMTGIKSAWTE